MKKLTILIMTVCLCVSTALFAADGTWNVAGVGNWATAGNWVGNNIANGAGSVAYITNIANSTITADTRTIGEIRTDTPYGWWITGGLITLDNSGSTPIIDISAGGIYMNCALAGSSGFNKTGAGNLHLLDTTISGDINLNAGSISLETDNAMLNADVKVNNNTILYVDDTWGTIYRYGNSVTINNGGLLQPVDGVVTTALVAPVTCNNPYDGGNKNAIACGNATFGLLNIYLTANTLIDVTHANADMNFYGPISGNYDLYLRGTGPGTMNIHAKIENNGNVFFNTWSNPRFELNVNNALPYGEAGKECQLANNSAAAGTGVTLDMNDKTQTVYSLTCRNYGGGTDVYLEMAGSGAGLFIVSNTFWSNPPENMDFRLTGGKLLINGNGFGHPITITNATFINNGNASAACYLNLQAGAVIGGYGLGWTGGDSSNLVLTADTTISPGNSIGTALCWNLEMLDGSEYDWEYGSSSSDLIDARGTLKLPSSGTITVNISGNPPANTTKTLISAASIVGSADAFYAADTGGNSVSFAKVGNNIEISVAPEPGAIGMLCLLGIAFLRRK